MKLAVCALFASFAMGAVAQSPVHGRVVGDDDFADAQAPWQAVRIAERIQGQGLLPEAKAQGPAADLAWPLRPIAGFDQFDYHGTKNFVDHDPRFPGFVQDYTCGTRTYDLASGYNHAGTDYYLWPFSWLMMDQGVVQIVAAAPGVILEKEDGNFDRDCDLASSTDPNFVSVLQDDGLTAIYLHMRSGSVTTLPVGTRVAAGDYLGLVGSSGSSTGPHLHFELRDANANVVDPRNGQCNVQPDRWIVFQAYEDPHIDSLSTHSAEPDQIVCGSVGGKNFDDVPHYKSVFAPGDELWVFASYRDQRNGEVTDFTIRRSDGSVFQWDFDLASQNEPLPFYSGTAFDWQYTLPADAPEGTWTITAKFQGQTYARTFAVGDTIFRADLIAAEKADAQITAAALACRRPHGQAAHGCTP
jgi:murein DD-endopeptidase MepM/ murein hydrolase activator NlpD